MSKLVNRDSSKLCFLVNFMTNTWTRTKLDLCQDVISRLYVHETFLPLPSPLNVRVSLQVLLGAVRVLYKLEVMSIIGSTIVEQYDSFAV